MRNFDDSVAELRLPSAESEAREIEVSPRISELLEFWSAIAKLGVVDITTSPEDIKKPRTNEAATFLILPPFPNYKAIPYLWSNK